MNRQWAMTTEAATDMALLGLAMLSIGGVLSYPFKFGSAEVMTHLGQIESIAWFKILVVALLCLGAAQALRAKHAILAQYVAALGFIAILSPIILLLAGIPASLGWKAAVINFGGLIMLIAGSSYLAARIFKVDAPGHQVAE